MAFVAEEFLILPPLLRCGRAASTSVVAEVKLTSSSAQGSHTLYIATLTTCKYQCAFDPGLVTTFLTAPRGMPLWRRADGQHGISVLLAASGWMAVPKPDLIFRDQR